MVLRNANWWVMAAAGGIIALGLALLAVPGSSIGPNARITGWLLLAAGGLELVAAAARRRPLVRRIEFVLGFVTIGVAALILFRPDTFPLLFVAISCLLIRAVGAVVAGFLTDGAVRLWVLARGFVDLLLGGILLAGAPLAAVISIISGNRWPDRAGAVLTNFVAISILATGISLLGLALHARRSARKAEPREDQPS